MISPRRQQVLELWLDFVADGPKIVKTEPPGFEDLFQIRGGVLVMPGMLVNAYTGQPIAVALKKKQPVIVVARPTD